MDNETFLRIERLVKKHAEKRKLPEADLDDLVQEVCVRILKKGNPKYLNRIIRLATIEIYRRSQVCKAKRKKLSIVQLDKYAINRLSERVKQSDNINASELFARIERAFGADARTMAQMRNEGRSVRYISRTLGTYTCKQVRYRLKKIKAAIDQMIRADRTDK